MNRVDKGFYKALRYFANNTRTEINDIKGKSIEIYKEFVPHEIESTLDSWGYLNLNGNTKFIITQNGLQQLRDLEKIKHSDITRNVAVISLILSIYTFAKLQGWVA